VLIFLTYVLGFCQVYLLVSLGNGNLERSRDVRCMPDNDI
jgi:hypothetical protein